MKGLIRLWTSTTTRSSIRLASIRQVGTGVTATTSSTRAGDHVRRTHLAPNAKLLNNSIIADLRLRCMLLIASKSAVIKSASTRIATTAAEETETRDMCLMKRSITEALMLALS